ncbi:hypothetical protein NMY22_g8603 [Coprinellus aureogranulatus]|nr:hypothetical protein NMY22_g8603 [Coprinellus aureogranulatus]
MDDIPTEILATAFEMGVLDQGVQFLPPICLVASTSSPRPTGQGEGRTPDYFHWESADKRDRLQRVIEQLLRQSHNWISAVIPADILERCRWSDMRNKLQELSINRGYLNGDSTFFKINDEDRVDLRRPPALRRFSMVGSDPPSQLLSPSLKYLNFAPGCTSLSVTLDQLSRVPNIESLNISKLKHEPRLPDQARIIRLNKLTSLTLSGVDYPSLLLCSLACPSLEVLSLGPRPRCRWQDPLDSSMTPLATFLSQWCNLEYTPTRLHTLEIDQCLADEDIPYLIRFLARLPNVVRLTINDDAINRDLDELTDENNILKSLASPQAGRSAGRGWICPLLGYLDIQQDVPFHHLLEVAQARGTGSTQLGGLQTLRKITGYICRDGTDEEMALLRSSIQQVQCECLACGVGFINLD